MATSMIHGRYVVCEAGTGSFESSVTSDGAVFQRNSVMEAVGPYDDLKITHPADQEVGGPGFIVMPGLVNARHHGRGVSTFRMVTTDGCLETWILDGWGRRRHNHYLMTLYTAIKMIESGTATVMYNHPQTPVSGLEDDLNQVLKGFAATRMRTAFSVYSRMQNRVVSEYDQQFISKLPADLEQGLTQYLAQTSLPAYEYFALFEGLNARHASKPESRVSALLSPSNVQWVSDDSLLRTKEYATRYHAAVHMYLAESG